MEVLTNGQRRTTNCCRSSFGCHVDVGDVAPDKEDGGGDLLWMATSCVVAVR